MKNFYLIIFIGFVNFSFAQGNRANEFGIKAGPSFSNYISNNPFDVFKPKIGFYLGGFTEFRLTNKIGLRPELFLSQNGAIFDTEIEVRQAIDEPATVERFKDRIDDYTIALPIKVRFHISDKFAIDLGPQFGYIFYRKRTVKINTAAIEEPIDYNFNDGAERFDVGATTGISFKIVPKLNLTSHYFIALKKTNGVNSSVLQIGIDYTFF